MIRKPAKKPALAKLAITSLTAALLLVPGADGHAQSWIDDLNDQFGWLWLSDNQKQTCAIILQNNGEFGSSIDKKTLDNKLLGGREAEVKLTLKGKFYISVVTPNGFLDAPIGADQGTRFTAYHRGTLWNGRRYGPLAGAVKKKVHIRRRLRSMSVQIGLRAERDTPFPAGRYSAQTIVRCEP